MPRRAPVVRLNVETTAELERIAKAPSTPQAWALRARIILAAGQGMPNRQIAVHLGATPGVVGKWRVRFCLFGIAGLRDGGRRGRPTKYDATVWKRVRAVLRQRPPDSKQRWTVRALARELGKPRSTVQDMLLLERGRLRRKPTARVLADKQGE